MSQLISPRKYTPGLLPSGRIPGSYIFPLLAGILGLCFYNFAITGFDLRFVPGDGGDSRFINYLLEHGYLYLKGSEAHFWNVTFMYPQENVLAFSDNMIGTLPLYSFFRLLGCDMQTAYQWWWISVSALNFTGCYIVLLKFTRNPFAAATGAFIFAFGLFNQSQMSYLQMNIRFGVPFIFYYAWMMVSKPSVRHYFYYCVWLLIQFYGVIYTGFISFYLSLILMLVAVLYQRNVKDLGIYFLKNNLFRVLFISILTIGLFYLLFKPYIDISSTTGLRLFKEVVPTLPTLSSYVFAHEASSTWGFLSHHLSENTANPHLHTIFPGALPLLAFCISGVLLIYRRIKKKPIDKLLAVFFSTTFISFLLFTRTENNYTLFALIFKLPGINSMRVLSRVMHVELFFLVVLLAFLIVHFSAHKRLRILVFSGVLLVAATLADNAFNPEASVRTSKKELQSRIEKVKERVTPEINNEKTMLALVNDTDQPAWLIHLDAMIAAQELNLKCVNGYSSYCPEDFGPFFLTAGREGLDQWLVSRKIDTAQLIIVAVSDANQVGHVGAAGTD